MHRSVTCSKNSQQMSSPHLMLNNSGRQGLHKSAVCNTNCSSTSLSPQAARLGCSDRPSLNASNSLMCCVMSVARTAFTISLLAYSTQRVTQSVWELHAEATVTLTHNGHATNRRSAMPEDKAVHFGLSSGSAWLPWATVPCWHIRQCPHTVSLSYKLPGDETGIMLAFMHQCWPPILRPCEQDWYACAVRHLTASSKLSALLACT